MRARFIGGVVVLLLLVGCICWMVAGMLRDADPVAAEVKPYVAGTLK